MAHSKPGQSARSESTKPRSSARRRRVPRTRIQPLAIASEYGSNLRIHGVPAADGGAITSDPANSCLRDSALTGFVSGNATPDARYARVTTSVAPCR